MNKKTICYLTHTMKPQERLRFEAQLKTDSDLAADFEVQKRVFQKMEKIRLSHKIQKLIAQDRLYRARKQKWLPLGISAGILILGVATAQYLVNPWNTNVKIKTPVAQKVSPSLPPVPAVLPVESLKKPFAPKSLPASNPQKTLKPPQPMPQDSSISYAQTTMKRGAPSIITLSEPMRSEKSVDSALLMLVGGYSSYSGQFKSTLPRIVLLEQQVFQQRLETKYQQTLSQQVRHMLTDYYQGNSPDPVLDEGRFNANLSWLVKSLYNIEIKEYGAAKYCLEKIEKDSYFFKEKQFCEILLQEPEYRNRVILNEFIKDTSNVFYEKARTLLER
jgi:hypothetical protein